MFHRGMKNSADGVKYSTEVCNIPRRCLSIPRRYEISRGGVKYSTKGVKHPTEVSNIPKRCLNIPRRCQIFHRGR